MSQRFPKVFCALLAAAVLGMPAAATGDEVQAEKPPAPVTDTAQSVTECPPGTAPPIRIEGAETDAPYCLINDEPGAARGSFNTIEDVFAAELPVDAGRPATAAPVIWREGADVARSPDAAQAPDAGQTSDAGSDADAAAAPDAGAAPRD